MSMSGNYKDRALVNRAYESILDVIKPGDVVTWIGSHKWWEIWSAIIHAGIQWQQRRMFGKKSNWKDTHAMFYLDESNTFSVELPKATTKHLREYCLANLTIYRLKFVELTPAHLRTMRKAVMDMVGEDYDLGQVLDLAINNILGYDHQRRLKFFDLGKRKKVCSVGVRAVFEFLYQSDIRTTDSRPGKLLFYKLNPEKWPEKKIKDYRGTDVEATAPAHFANTDYFDYEFELVARFNNGEQIYPEA